MNDQGHATSKRPSCVAAGVVLAVLLAGAALAIALIHTAACSSDGRVGDEASGPAEATTVQAPAGPAPVDPVEILLERDGNSLVYGIRGVPNSGSGPVDCQTILVVHMGWGENATQFVGVIEDGHMGGGGTTRRSIFFDELSSRPLGATLKLYAKDADDPGREYRLIEEKFISLTAAWATRLQPSSPGVFLRLPLRSSLRNTPEHHDGTQRKSRTPIGPEMGRGPTVT